MTTKISRINITLDAEHFGQLASLAKLQGKSISAKARELIVEALERDDDAYLLKIVKERDNETSKWFSHEEVWGDLKD